MNIYVVLYYVTAKDMEYPEGTEPRTAYYCPGGFYSQPGVDRTIPLYNNEHLKYERVNAYSIPEAYNKFFADHPTAVIVGVEDERIDNPSVAVA